MLKKIFCTIAFLSVTQFSLYATMHSYMSIEGESQGLISEGGNAPDSLGNLYQEGHENEITVAGFNDEIEIPTDPHTGLPLGGVIHKGVTILKYLDKSSPLLMQALVTGESLQIKIRFFRVSMVGTREHYFSIEYEDCKIAEIKTIHLNSSDPDNAHFTTLEEVTFTYQKVTKTHEIAGTSAVVELADNL
jgi:type VI secretion system secreted protein Hcp